MTWLDRQSFLGANSDDVLKSITVGLVGLGGGGSHVVQQLAHVGIGSFVLVDPDSIEDTNLNRLVGATFEDVANETAKVEIARRLIKGVNPGAAVEPIQDVWQAAGDALKRCDVIVGGLDSVRAKDELDAFCRRVLISYIDMGMDVHGEPGQHLLSGQVILSTAGNPCLRCFGLVTEKALAAEAARYGAAGSKPQVVWPNGVLASTAVGLVMQLVTPWHPAPVESAYLEYDGNRGTVAPSYRLKHLDGFECEHYPAVERGDPGFDIRALLRVTAEPEIDDKPPTETPPRRGLIAWIRRCLGWDS